MKTPFGLDNPRCIVYEPSLKVYGLSSVRVEPARVGGLELSSSSFQLVDETTFAGMLDTMATLLN
jgi:DNA damage-binding protein 1